LTKKTEPKKKETKPVAVPALGGRKRKHCEDCGLKQPCFGLPTDRKSRWCGGCAKEHAGAVNVVTKHCGSPQKKQDQKIYVDFLQKFTCLMKTSGCVCTGCRMCSPGFLRQWCSNHREVADHCPGSLGHELQTQVMFEAVCCVITCYTILNC